MQRQTTILASAACAALLGGVSTAALAQIGGPLVQQPSSALANANPLVVPKLEVVNGINRAGGCERFGDDAFRKAAGDTFMEIVSGDTGLIMIGPDIDRATSIRYVRDNRTTVSGVIERRIAKGQVCGPNVVGMSAIVVRFNLPDVAAVERGTIEIFGKKERLLQVDTSKIQPQLCDGGEIGMIPCANTQPVVVAALDLKVVPRPVTTSINPAGPVTLNGDRHVQVATLTGQRLGLAKLAVQTGIRVPEIGTSDTRLPALVDIFLAPNTTKRVEPKIGVELRRGGQVRLVDVWDTANAGGDAASRRFNKIGYEVRRGAAEAAPPPPPPPPPPPAASLDPFDPGNVLYVVRSGNTTTTDNFQQIYHALSREEHCAGITVPAVKPPPDQNAIEANEREVTVPDIRWGVKNNSNTVIAAGAVAELRFNNRVVATFNVTQAVQPNQTLLAPAFRRPDSTNTVARLTGGGVCYHKGTPRDGWNDNDGYTITILNTTKVKRID